MNLKCRSSGIKPHAAVVVATVRALKLHGGGPAVSPGKPLPHSYTNEDVELVKKGVSNLVRHIENTKKFGVPVVVAMNVFPTDTPAEHAVIKEAALAAGADDCVLCTHHSEGGKGAAALGEAVVAACEKNASAADFKLLYPKELSIKAGGRKPYDERVAPRLEIAPSSAVNLGTVRCTCSSPSIRTLVTCDA